MKRRETLLPLLAAYLMLFALYAWQAAQRQTVTLFSDEIEFAQISRAIADTGHATLGAFGRPASSFSLFTYLAAPAWWIDDVGTAYMLVKLLGVALMTATIFPAYGLARLVVSRRYALFAAIGATVAPALSYSPFLVDEPIAYPAATLSFFLIARAFIAPSTLNVALMLAACGLGVLIRTQLAVMFAVLGLVALYRLWCGERARRWRTSWSLGDWAGFATLAIGIALLLSAAIGRRSFSWYLATGFEKQRMLEYSLWAFGALAIGVGILPLVATLATVLRRREPVSTPTWAFGTLTLSAIAVFGMYTAVKAAYLSRTFAIVVAERNLIYLTPLLFAGMALALGRRQLSLPATAAATILAVYLVSTTPYQLDRYPYYEAHGLAIAALANRVPRWPADTIETVLVVVAICAGLALAGLTQTRSRKVAGAGAAALAAFAVAWSVSTEIYAANGERRASDQAYAALAKPADWVDRTTGRKGTLFVGQGVSDPVPFWQLQFWNPSMRWFWGIDGSTPGGVTPDLLRPDGTQYPADLGAEYAVVTKGVRIDAPQVTTVGDYVVYRLGGQPVRLAEASSGIADDGWTGTQASYTRYDVDPAVKGFVKVVFSRQGAGFPQLKPVRVAVTVGPVVVNAENQPAIGKVTATGEGMLGPGQITSLLVPVPPVPWRAEVSVSSTFVPHDLDPSLGDRRKLGAVVSFGFVPNDPLGG